MSVASREIRFALVLNGGVSLAVWMGGVTREIDALMSASEQGDAGPAMDQHVEAWRQILLKIGSGSVPKVTVDLIAGTSAGGLNGALLGSALARGKRLANGLRDLWLTAGDLSLGALVPAKSSTDSSLLDGIFFEQQVRAALGLPDSSNAEALPSRGDCTLLITATALAAGTETGIGSGTDSRRVYRFVNRTQSEGTDEVPGWSRNDFVAHGEALALAARASASFPLAFTPVFETEELSARRADATADGQQDFLADGGVLDNAPFEPIFQSLMKRPLSGQFDRYLVYIKPSAGAAGPQLPLPTEPNLLQTMGRVVGAAREPDQREASDVLLAARRLMNHTANEQDLILLRCWDGTTSTLGYRQLDSAAAALFEHYCRGRIEASLAAPEPPTDPPPIQPLPVAGGSAPQMNRDVAEGDVIDWGVSTAERIIRWWGRLLNNMDDAVDADSLNDAFEAVAIARRYVTVRIETCPGVFPDLATTQAISGLLWTACRAVATVIRGTTASEPTPERFMNASLDVEVMTCLFAWGKEDYTDPPRFSYREITPGSRPLMDIGASGQQPRWSQHHLYGTQWGHFGAFASTEWRRHDWLWGRLDGASSLVEILFSRMPCRDAGAELELRNRLAASILVQEGETPTSIVTGAAAVIDASPWSLWRAFARNMSAATRGAIVAKVEAVPAQNLPPSGARLVLAALGGSRPASDRPTRWGRLKEDIKLRGVRAAMLLPRWWLRRQVSILLKKG